jgi:hypothetical protein
MNISEQLKAADITPTMDAVAAYELGAREALAQIQKWQAEADQEQN